MSLSNHSDADTTASPARRADEPYLPPHLVRLMHWLLAGSLIWMLFTGLAINAMARPDGSLFGSYPTWLPPWRMLLWHRVGAILFAAALVPVIVSYIRRWGAWRRWHPRQWIHLLLMIGGMGMIASGLILLRGWGSADMQHLVRLCHRWGGLAVMSTVLVVHTVLGLTVFLPMLVSSFTPWRKPRWGRVGWFAVSLLVLGGLLTNVAWRADSERTLIARRIAPVNQPLDQRPWASARPLHLTLTNGVGFDRGTTVMELRALHDGRSLFVRVSWADPSADRLYMPWRRTADGWQRLQTDANDEKVYYEDKMAIMFPIDSSPAFAAFGCATSCHGGGGRSYGFKSTPALTDVWHWKASRTDPVGHADDKYWNADGRDVNEAGRHGDPSVAGTGYVKNKDKTNRRPAFLPAHRGAVIHGAIIRPGEIPWSADAEMAVAPGTIIPGLVISAFQGDRGDVHCMSRYADGRWTVYLRRALQTGSQYDVQFEPGGTYPFACAAFDHASKRHAYTCRSYAVHLEGRRTSG